MTTKTKPDKVGWWLCSSISGRRPRWFDGEYILDADDGLHKYELGNYRDFVPLVEARDVGQSRQEFHKWVVDSLKSDCGKQFTAIADKAAEIFAGVPTSEPEVINGHATLPKGWWGIEKRDGGTFDVKSDGTWKMNLRERAIRIPDFPAPPVPPSVPVPRRFIVRFKDSPLLNGVQFGGDSGDCYIEGYGSLGTVECIERIGWKIVRWLDESEVDAAIAEKVRGTNA